MLPAGEARIYLACGVTNMRKSSHSLAAQVQTALNQKPYSVALYIFSKHCLVNLVRINVHRRTPCPTDRSSEPAATASVPEEERIRGSKHGRGCHSLNVYNAYITLTSWALGVKLTMTRRTTNRQ